MTGADDLKTLAKRWTMPRPSAETLDFLGQGLAGLDPGTWQTCRRALAALAAGYRSGHQSWPSPTGSPRRRPGIRTTG
jgi:hypothetical protein